MGEKVLVPQKWQGRLTTPHTGLLPTRGQVSHNFVRILKTSEDGDSTTFPGSSFQIHKRSYRRFHWKYRFFLMCSLGLSGFEAC